MNNLFDDILTIDVLHATIKAFTSKKELFTWCKPNVWEKEILNILKSKYEVEKSLGTDYHRIRASLYTIMDIFVRDKIVYVDGGNKWEYPLFRFDLSSLWMLQFHRLGDLYFPMI